MHQNDRVERMGDISTDGRVSKLSIIQPQWSRRGMLVRIPREAKEVQMDRDDGKFRIPLHFLIVCIL
ncbi:hypothetical protein Y032_0041g360 [Ancylostoma ceylanicum]|uniref:Uncharacterized protein n=1 Tax=Ancylostoma ceylanicum TaxID=53326 RepID=A0A016UGU3_9BILA|nr:hypothetical protein Y032_0041g360 [Ancylostoma ceylanicum]